MSHRMGKAVLVVCGLLLMPQTLLAQQESLEELAREMSKIVLLKQCEQFFPVEQKELDRMFGRLYSVAVNAFGEKQVEAATEAALDHEDELIEFAGLGSFCDLLRDNIKFHTPEIGKIFFPK